MEKGKITAAFPSLEEIRRHAKADLASFDNSYKRLLNPHVYKVSVTEGLRALKLDLIRNYLGEL
jgi:nicotinate phosphoribosyltransferase